MYNAGQDIGGDVVPLHDPSRRGDPGGLPNRPNLAGVRKVQVHVCGESIARVDLAGLGGVARPLHRPPLARRDAAPEGQLDIARRVMCCPLTQEPLD